MSQVSTLYKSATTADTYTQNGMRAHSTTGSHVLNLFYEIGSARNKDLSSLFGLAYAENADLTIRTLQYNRDIRQGQGERQMFRTLFAQLINYDQDTARRILAKIPELGRWDDVFVCIGTPLERDALRMVSEALNKGDQLAAKWCPRGGKPNKDGSPNLNKIAFVKLHRYMKTTPGQLRRRLAELSKDVVEVAMCQKEWGRINYNHVPSIASSRYRTAFWRNDPVRYPAWIEALKKAPIDSKEVKVNAGAIYPYNLVQACQRQDGNTLATEQWKRLPDFIKGNSGSMLPMVDVSQSMEQGIPGARTTCMDVAVSLGLYIAERNNGIFKDQIITFTDQPQFLHIPGQADLLTKVKTAKSRVGYDTNFEAALRLILEAATKANLPESEMPKVLLVLSDMQLNQFSGGQSYNPTADKMISDLYAQAGYQKPQIVYWNLNSSLGGSRTAPAKSNNPGVALVRGFSPSIMEDLLSTPIEEFNPYNVMLKRLMNPRYDY